MKLVVEHDVTAPFASLVAGYAEAAEDVGTLKVFGVSGKDEDLQPGSRSDLESAIATLGDRARYVQFKTDDETTFQVFRESDPDVWKMEASLTSDAPPNEKWVQAMAGMAKRAIRLPGFRRAALERRRWSPVAFVPLPPIARSNHVVTTTVVEVAASYDDPDSFWTAWDLVEEIGDLRLCTRGLDDLDDERWLARTFEDTMQLARQAKPGLTLYSKPYWDDDFRAWWEFGDVQDEKAGYPALAPVGYDEATNTVELTGFITKTPLRAGGPEPRHVLIREIFDVRALAKGKKDQRGRPVETVRITWPEEWMALSERRPLLDNGAQVFYRDRKTNTTVEVTY